MTRIPALCAAALVAASTLAAPAKAGPISTLEECYQAVITWCVETFPEHADQCGQSSSLNDCDDEFGNASAGLSVGRGLYRAGPAVPPRTFARLISGAQIMRASASVIRR